MISRMLQRKSLRSLILLCVFGKCILRASGDTRLEISQAGISRNYVERKETNLLSHICPHFGVSGELESELFGALTDDLNPDNNPIVDPSGQVIWIRGPNQEKFLQELIMEAGRHVLYPQNQEDSTKENLYQRYSYLNEETKDKSKETLTPPTDMETLTICQQKCHRYKPVCGSDKKVYKSECHLLQSNCGSDVNVSDWENCRGRHFLCPASCLDISDPVCGMDGQLYHNICIMRKRNCGKLIDVQPLKFCYFQPRVSKSDDFCPKECREIYSPVCGSDGVVYYNECFLKMKNCGRNIKHVDMENCAHVPKCPEVCIPLYDPVCGSDGRLYINHCTMLKKNCGSRVTRTPKDFCNNSEAEAS